MYKRQATYHRGREYRAYDGAGVQTAVGHDFEGNLLRQTRVLARLTARLPLTSTGGRPDPAARIRASTR
ncbi:MAG: hypothetical protein KUG77_05670 [Nannocystaceae bacterium]|nr:hypothetical protein [Nannocystaceae bacterium]